MINQILNCPSTDPRPRFQESRWWMENGIIRNWELGLRTFATRTSFPEYQREHCWFNEKSAVPGTTLMVIKIVWYFQLIQLTSINNERKEYKQYTLNLNYTIGPSESSSKCAATSSVLSVHIPCVQFTINLPAKAQRERERERESRGCTLS